MSDSHRMMITTTDSAEAAAELAKGLVAARLAACVQIVGPVSSVYRWEGAVEVSQEWQCLVKTTADREAAVTAHLKANHSYDLPEVISVPITGGSAAYLGWLTRETRNS